MYGHKFEVHSKNICNSIKILALIIKRSIVSRVNKRVWECVAIAIISSEICYQNEMKAKWNRNETKIKASGVERWAGEETGKNFPLDESRIIWYIFIEYK